MELTLHTKVVTSTQADNSLESVPFVRLHHVSWDTYQALQRDLGEHRSARLAYDRGVLEIKMPSKLHELINRLLERIVTTLTEELGMSIVSLGSTTFDQEEADQGVEPDSCFYIQNAERVDPTEDAPPSVVPPDLVVEVDITSSSKSRLTIYQQMGVPEIWRYDRKGFKILQLREGHSVECDRSLTFPAIATQNISHLLEQTQRISDQNRIIREFRSWLRQN